MAEANGGPAEPLRKAAFGILAAYSMGIGSVWLGTWPQMERVEAQRGLSK